MPPCIPLKDSDATSNGRDVASVLDLAKIRKAIPKEAFEKSVVRSFYFMIFDYVIWFGSIFLMGQLAQSDLWTNFAFWQKALALLVYWNVSGFFMWATFIIGHDCGHGTFSDSELLNDIVGHITHSSIMVPFYPWQVCYPLVLPYNAYYMVSNNPHIIRMIYS